MNEQVVEKAAELIPNVYEDGLKSTVKESGDILALIPQTLKAVLAPLRIWIAQKEYNVAETTKLLEKKLENVSEEKIVTPDAYVAVPAFQAIAYSMSNEELRELYANLLSKAMCIDTKEKVHPSFVEIIKQLSPLDAFVFKTIMQQSFTPAVDLILENKERDFQTLKRSVTAIDMKKVDLVCVSIENLQRQGLISIPNGEYLSNDEAYNLILNSEYFLGEKKKYQTVDNGFEFTYKKKMVNKTNLGELFFDVCVKEI